MRIFSPLLAIILAAFLSQADAGNPPAHDNRSAPAVLLTGTLAEGDSRGSTLEPGEVPPHPFGPESWVGSVWWEWQADSTGWQELSAGGVPGGIAVWADSNVLGAVRTGPGHPGQIYFRAEAGKVYRIAAGTPSPEQGGLVALRIVPRGPDWELVSAEVTPDKVVLGTSRARSAEVKLVTRGIGPWHWNRLEAQALRCVDAPGRGARHQRWPGRKPQWGLSDR